MTKHIHRTLFVIAFVLLGWAGIRFLTYDTPVYQVVEGTVERWDSGAVCLAGSPLLRCYNLIGNDSTVARGTPVKIYINEARAKMVERVEANGESVYEQTYKPYRKQLIAAAIAAALGLLLLLAHRLRGGR